VFQNMFALMIGRNWRDIKRRFWRWGLSGLRFFCYPYVTQDYT
jgi:hypothetical protein